MYLLRNSKYAAFSKNATTMYIKRKLCFVLCRTSQSQSPSDKCHSQNHCSGNTHLRLHAHHSHSRDGRREPAAASSSCLPAELCPGTNILLFILFGKNYFYFISVLYNK